MFKKILYFTIGQHVASVKKFGSTEKIHFVISHERFRELERKVQIIFINYDHNNFLWKYTEQGQIKFIKGKI